MPYIDTTLLINELINLQYDSSNGVVRIYEKSGMRKDRYSSLSYNYYVAIQMEQELRKRDTSLDMSVSDTFNVRAPNIYGRRGR